MIAPSLSTSTARQFVEMRIAGDIAPKPLEEIRSEIGALPRGDMEQRIQSLTRALSDLKARISDKQVARFDSEAAILLHRELGGLPIRIATDRGFWRYLACGPLYDVVCWRYAGSTNLQNFGIGRQWEALPERLWFRAHVAFDPEGPDPYTLARRGGVDFWISGLIRVLYSGDHNLARGLVKFQYPLDGRFQGRSYSPATLSTDGIRALYKRLRHFNATTEYAAYSQEEAVELITSLASDLPRI